jgi:hypothetical protein
MRRPATWFFAMGVLGVSRCGEQGLADYPRCLRIFHPDTDRD